MTLQATTPSPLATAAADLAPLTQSLAASWQGESGTAAHGALQVASQTVATLAADDGTLQRALAEGVAKVMSAGKDIVGIVTTAFQAGATVVSSSLVAGPIGWLAAGSQVQALITKTLAAVKKRLELLATELIGPTQALLQLGGVAAEQVSNAGLAPASGSSPSTTQPVTYGGAGTSDADTSPADAGDGAPTPQAQMAVQKALSAVGTPYQWGGNTPGVGLDCSGLTSWAYREAGVDIPRVANSQTVGRQVTADSLLPGDLLVWEGHVAMYVGDGQIVEAGDPVQTNPVRTSNMGMPFKGYWRPTG